MPTRLAHSSRRAASILIAAAAWLIPPPPCCEGEIIDKQKALDAQSFWDNQDWDWYKENIPFFECPDTELVTTYYYRWELITKHLTYGSPNSGYSFTEFIDRPFWSGTYGAISCPAGHQLYEVRCMHDPTYGQDYARYWFRTPGAQPRRYGCWLADGIWATHEVHPNAVLMKELLPDLKSNYEAWAKRQFDPEVGLFWQNGHDDGMEFNINSRQTADILRGANGFRPGFNAYMYADAMAVARVAQLAGEEATARDFEVKAAELKSKVQKLLWDPKREFFFPMSTRDEKDKEGNVVKKHTLTYESGKFAGDSHGREEHGYIPWQFNMVEPGYEAGWKFLMDPEYFFAAYGPTTVERNDPMFHLSKSCCWWSGQSWPYSTAQTLKAMANLLQNYEQKVISRGDYYKLLHIFAISHRKDGKPYLAEALHPDTGSFEGHDGFNHSEHYFHSSFNDLVITGLVGLKTGADETVEIDSLAPPEWRWFALDDVSYHGHLLSIVWDQDGSRYKLGAGLHLRVDGAEVASRNTLGKLRAELPLTNVRSMPRPKLMNYAVNNDGDYYPRFTASFTGEKSALSKVNDGNAWYALVPPNRWTTVGSPNARDWLQLELGMKRKLNAIRLYILDDGGQVVAPAAYEVEYWSGKEWRPIPEQKRSPAQPKGHRANIVQFADLETDKLKATFTHAGTGRSGLTEFEAWGEGTFPYLAAPPPAGNVALNMTGAEFPRARASFSDVFGGAPEKAIDGKINFLPNPVNRWTTYGSPNVSDWLEVDFGMTTRVERIDLHIYDDRGGVQAPTSYTAQYWSRGEWQSVAQPVATPAKPTGGATNSLKFAPVSTDKIRVVFVHEGKARSGVTEMEIWKE